MAQITKDTMIGELLRDQEHIDSIAEVLFGIGMHCLGCPSSQMETIEQAAMVHGIEPQELVEPFFLFVYRKLLSISCRSCRFTILSSNLAKLL